MNQFGNTDVTYDAAQPYRVVVFAVAQAYAGINCAFCPVARSVQLEESLVLRVGHKPGFPNGVGLFHLNNRVLVGNVQELNGGMGQSLRSLLP